MRDGASILLRSLGEVDLSHRVIKFHSWIVSENNVLTAKLITNPDKNMCRIANPTQRTTTSTSAATGDGGFETQRTTTGTSAATDPYQDALQVVILISCPVPIGT